jgi:putative flippase GtrA/SAM-dependent methyltransferase
MADPASHPEGLRRCSLIRKWLAVPGLDAAGLDGSERMVMHAGVLQHKKLLRDVFGQFHDTFVKLDNRYFSKTEGITVELGAGVAPVRDSYPHVLATDIVADPRLDMTLDAQSMALSDGSVHAIYGQNCFHHFPNPARFFGEAVRVLQPGGGIILIEPYYGAVASWVYPRLFASEGFDKKAPSWQTVQSGPMVGANQGVRFKVMRRFANRQRVGKWQRRHSASGCYWQFLRRPLKFACRFASTVITVASSEGNVRYNLVQLFAYVVDLGGFALMSKMLFIPIVPSNVLAKLAAGAFAYIAHRYFTFSGGPTRDLMTSGIKYAALLAINIPLSSAILLGLSNWLPTVPAKIVSDAVCIGFNYLVSRHFVFSGPAV